MTCLYTQPNQPLPKKLYLLIKSALPHWCQLYQSIWLNQLVKLLMGQTLAKAVMVKYL